MLFVYYRAVKLLHKKVEIEMIGRLLRVDLCPSFTRILYPDYHSDS